MALQMKSHCEKCSQELDPLAEAYICSYECTFCRDCAKQMNLVCPNCRGELLRRPTREIGR